MSSIIRYLVPWNKTGCLRIARVIICINLLLAFTGCATQTQRVSPFSSPMDKLEPTISAAFLEGNPEGAREILAEELRTQPQNGYLHLLNGLSYQLTDGSKQSLELAQVGYEAAVKFAPGYYWSQYFAGTVALNNRNYREAAEQFSQAVMDNPDRPQALAGLAVSAYYAGDLGVAKLAAEKAMFLTPGDPLMLRTAAYVAAAGGDRESLDAMIQHAKALPAAANEIENHKTRLAQLVRTAALAQSSENSAILQKQEQSPADAPPAPVENPRQVMVEVTLLLSQDTTTRRIGINLLDGLTVQFGAEQLTENKSATGSADTFSRVITTALRVPQITYSLNLFNTKDDFYDVVVRPSLVASLGQQSDFFIGRQLTVGVSGINLGSLQPIEVGTSVKILPLEITQERTKFRVDVIRSFFVPDTSGSFQQAVTTFKQTVGATVEVDFGKSLILSGLYEAVNVGGSSRVPLLGDIPVVDTLFNSRVKTQRRDAAIVLVTPRLPGSIDTGTREFRTETLNRLLTFWKDLVDPRANMDGIINKLSNKVSKYFKPQPGDLKMPATTDEGTLKLIVKETLARM